MVELTVLTPTRDRPENAERLAGAFVTLCTADTRLILLVDPDDPQLEAYGSLRFSLPSPRVTIRKLPSRMRLGPTLNFACSWYRQHDSAIGFMGDDHLPRTLGWDRQILSALADLGHGFAYGNDLLQGARLPTACFVTSSVPLALDYLVPGGLVHLYIDDAWKALGDGMGRIRYLPNTVIEHLHPAAGKAPMDNGYLEANSKQQYDDDDRRWADYRQNWLPGDLDKLRGLVAAENRP